MTTKASLWLLASAGHWPSNDPAASGLRPRRACQPVPGTCRCHAQKRCWPPGPHSQPALGSGQQVGEPRTPALEAPSTPAPRPPARRPPARVRQAGAAAGPRAPRGLGPRPGSTKLRLEVRAWSGTRGQEETLCPGHVAERRLRRDDSGSPCTPTPLRAQPTCSLHPAGSPRAGGRQASLLPADARMAEPGPEAPGPASASRPCTAAALGPRPAVPLPVPRGPAELSPLPPARQAGLGRTRRCSEPRRPRRGPHTRLAGSWALPPPGPSVPACRRLPVPGPESHHRGLIGQPPPPELAFPGHGDFLGRVCATRGGLRSPLGRRGTLHGPPTAA